MQWTLHMHPKVTSYLYTLRDVGKPIRERIFALKAEDRPWDDAIELPGHPGRYETDADDHWIGFEVDREKRVITILYVVPN